MGGRSPADGRGDLGGPQRGPVAVAGAAMTLKFVLKDSAELMSTLVTFRCDKWAADSPCFEGEADFVFWDEDDWYILKDCLVQQLCPEHRVKQRQPLLEKIKAP